MKRLFRKWVGQSVFLWKLWFRLKNRNNNSKRKNLSRRFFNKDTQFYVGGYQRSGNTFIAHLLNDIYPDLNFVHHLHKAAVVKASINLGLPTFVLIRHPKDAIASQYLKHFSANSDTLPEKIDTAVLLKYTEDYLWYYSFVLKKKSQLNIIPFNQLIKNTGETIKRFSLFAKKDIADERVEKVVEDSKSNYRGSTTKLGGSKPTKYKEENKAKIQKGLINLSEYSKSCEVFNSIVDNY